MGSRLLVKKLRQGWGNGFEGKPTACQKEDVPQSSSSSFFPTLLDILIVFRFYCKQWCNEYPCNHILMYMLNYVLEKVLGSGMIGSKGLNIFRALVSIVKLLSKKVFQFMLPVLYVWPPCHAPSTYFLVNCRYFFFF